MLSPLTSRATAYTRDQALADLNRAEEKPEDAQSDLAVITSSQQPGEDLQAATDSFVRILRAAGNQQTEKVQTAYKHVGGRVKPDETRAGVTDTFLSILKAQNRHVENAAWCFSLVDASLKTGERRQDATAALVTLVQREGNEDPMRTQRQFRLIDQSLLPGDSRLEATEQFLRLREVETPSGTAAGFDLVSRSRRPDEPRPEVVDSFIELRKADDHTVRASMDFQAVDRALWKGGTRAELTREMLGYLAQTGGEQSHLAREQFLAAHGITGPVN